MTSSGLGIAFLGQQRQLPFEGFSLALIAGETEFQRLDVLLDQIELLLELDLLAVEDDVLALDDRVDVGIACLFHHDIGKLEFAQALRFGAEPCDDSFQAQPAKLQHPLVRAGCCGIEGQQDIAFLDRIAFAYAHLLDDAAFQMLDDLVVAGRDEASLRDNSGSKRCRRRPEAEASERGEENRQADDAVHPDRARHVAIPFELHRTGRFLLFPSHVVHPSMRGAC